MSSFVETNRLANYTILLMRTLLVRHIATKKNFFSSSYVCNPKMSFQQSRSCASLFISWYVSQLTSSIICFIYCNHGLPLYHLPWILLSFYRLMNTTDTKGVRRPLIKWFPVTFCILCHWPTTGASAFWDPNCPTPTLSSAFRTSRWYSWISLSLSLIHI